MKSEVFRAAKENISTEDRWIKNALRFEGRRCLLGALYFCQRDPSEKIYYFLEKIVKEFHKEKHPWSIDGRSPYENISQFNDHPYTTHADVMEVLDRAIKQAEEEEAAASVMEEEELVLV